MLRSLKSILGQPISARDGDIGNIHDFFFEDDSWIVRYLVVDTGRWLPGRKVLLSPQVLQSIVSQSGPAQVDLTREQIETSPDIDTDKPVSRQHELELHRHFTWAPYWAAGAQMINPVTMPPSTRADRVVGDTKTTGDSHLHSARHVHGYRITARDGSIGHVDDLIAGAPDWTIRYIVVDTRNWLPGKRVLIAPEWSVGLFDWRAHSLTIDLMREQIKGGPEFEPTKGVNRQYESRLFDYYGRPAYWTHEEEAMTRR